MHRGLLLAAMVSLMTVMPRVEGFAEDLFFIGGAGGGECHRDSGPVLTPVMFFVIVFSYEMAGYAAERHA